MFALQIYRTCAERRSFVSYISELTQRQRHRGVVQQKAPISSLPK